MDGVSVEAQQNTAVKPRHHRTCVHSKYLMTCEQYDALWEAADGRCQICEQLERYMPGKTRGQLQIDHEPRLGYWAVRGLLCVACNVRIGSNTIDGPEVDRYLANPWYQTLPYVQAIKPEENGELPMLNKGVALRLVTEAAAAYSGVRLLPKHYTLAREVRLGLVDAVRVAHHSGARQTEISTATRGLWDQGTVLAAIRERRQQPTVPLSWRRGRPPRVPSVT
jgi:hypothetical protein